MLPTWFELVGLIKMMQDDMEMNGEFNKKEDNIPKERRIDDGDVIDAEFVEIKDIPQPIDESMRLHAEYSNDVEGYQRMMEGKQ